MRKKFLGIRDISRELGLGPRRVYTLARRGELPLVRIGGVMKCPLAAWRKWTREVERAALDAARRGPEASSSAAGEEQAGGAK